MTRVRAKGSRSFCSQIFATMAIFFLIFTNNSSARFFFHEHIKVHNDHDHPNNTKHSFNELHDHEAEAAYTHTHVDRHGVTHTHNHHHDHCSEFTSPIVACILNDCELLPVLSSLTLKYRPVTGHIFNPQKRELLRPPIPA